MNTGSKEYQGNLPTTVAVNVARTYAGGAIPPFPVYGQVIRAPWVEVAQIPRGIWLVNWRGLINNNPGWLGFRVAFIENADPVLANTNSFDNWGSGAAVQLFEGDDSGMTVVRGSARVFMALSVPIAGVVWRAGTPGVPAALQLHWTRLDTDGADMSGTQNLTALMLPGVSSARLTTERQIVHVSNLPSLTEAWIIPDFPPESDPRPFGWRPTSARVTEVVYAAGGTTPADHVRVFRPGAVAGSVVECGRVGQQGRDQAGYGYTSTQNTQTNMAGAVFAIGLDNRSQLPCTSATVVFERGPQWERPDPQQGWPTAQASTGVIGAVWTQVLNPNSSRSYLRVENRGAVQGALRFGSTWTLWHSIPAGGYYERITKVPTAAVEVQAPAGASDFWAFEESA